jgi:hypothetical protein
VHGIQTSRPGEDAHEKSCPVGCRIGCHGDSPGDVNGESDNEVNKLWDDLYEAEMAELDKV